MAQPDSQLIIVSTEESGLRLDKLVSLHIESHSRSYLQKLIQNNDILVNDSTVKPSYCVEEGDRITLSIPAPVETEMNPEQIDIEVVYEDAHLIVVNKAAGMVVHPGAGVHSGTLVNALLYHCRDLSGIGGRLRPGIVHRLDKNTTGLLVVAKSDLVHVRLQKQFAEKEAARTYRALVWRTPAEQSGEITLSLERSKRDRKKFVAAETGKSAHTIYDVVESFEYLSLLELKLKTGRTHQIRAHLNALHHPVFGDPEYNGRRSQINQISTLSNRKHALYLLGLIDRQALHAWKLGFTHPVSNEKMVFSTPLPNDFNTVLDELKTARIKP